MIQKSSALRNIAPRFVPPWYLLQTAVTLEATLVSKQCQARPLPAGMTMFEFCSETPNEAPKSLNEF